MNKKSKKQKTVSLPSISHIMNEYINDTKNSDQVQASFATDIYNEFKNRIFPAIVNTVTDPDFEKNVAGFDLPHIGSVYYYFKLSSKSGITFKNILFTVTLFGKQHSFELPSSTIKDIELMPYLIADNIAPFFEEAYDEVILPMKKMYNIQNPVCDKTTTDLY